MAAAELAVTDKYTILREIGKGVFGTTYIATKKGDDSSGKLVALKIVPSDMFKDSEFVIPNDILNSCSNENLLCYHSITNMTMDGNPVIVIEMQYIEGITLTTYLKNYSTKNLIRVDLVEKFALHMLHMLYALHSKGVAHRDVKPDNIMYTSDRLVLIDFGLSCLYDQIDRLKEAKCRGRAGTPRYLPPEDVVMLSKPIKDYDFGSIDMWAFGYILYQLTYGEHPDVSRFKGTPFIRDQISDQPSERSLLLTALIEQSLSTPWQERLTAERGIEMCEEYDVLLSADLSDVNIFP